MRQWRFTSGDEIQPGLIKDYLEEAISVAAQGREITADRSKPVVVPEELAQALSENEKAAANFAAWGRGKRREYAAYIADARRQATRVKRLEKIIPMIAAGRGLHDKYR